MLFLSRARCGWGVKEQSQKLCVWYGLPTTWPRALFHNYFPVNYALSRGMTFIVRAKRILERYKKQFGNFIWCEQYYYYFFFLHKLIFTFTTSLDPPSKIVLLLLNLWPAFQWRLTLQLAWLEKCVCCRLLWLTCCSSKAVFSLVRRL